MVPLDFVTALTKQALQMEPNDRRVWAMATNLTVTRDSKISRHAWAKPGLRKAVHHYPGRLCNRSVLRSLLHGGLAAVV